MNRPPRWRRPANLCSTCGQDFGSVSAFDAHRVGRYLQAGASEYTGLLADWTPERGRRCLTVEELRERGWTRDSRGRWRRPSVGAPWASSQDQVTTERPPETRTGGHRHLRPGRRSTRLPESRGVKRQK
jgi:hypothetical protein